MTNLVLECDAAGNVPLRIEGEVLTGTLPILLSDGLKASLLDWNDRMAFAISADLHQTAMQRLNEEGQKLADRIVQEHSGAVRIRYRPE